MVRQIPSYIQDLTDFLQKNNRIEKNTGYLVSLDVRSLYSSIHNSEGIKAVKTSSDNFPRRTVAIVKNIYNRKNYLQVKGRINICEHLHGPFRKKIYLLNFRRTFTKLLKIH